MCPYLLTLVSVTPHRVSNGFSSESKMSSLVDVCVRPSTNSSSSAAMCVWAGRSRTFNAVPPANALRVHRRCASLRAACGAPLVLRMGCPFIPDGVSSTIPLASPDLKALWMWCICHVHSFSCIVLSLSGGRLGPSSTGSLIKGMRRPCQISHRSWMTLSTTRLSRLYCWRQSGLSLVWLLRSWS